MQKPFDNGHDVEATIRRVMGRPQQQGIPLIADGQGKPIGVPAVVMALNKPVMAALEEMIRRVIKEELACIAEEGSNGEAQA